MQIDELRSLFPVVNQYIYLNHSGTGPMSIRVQKAMEDEIHDVVNQGAAGLPKWYRQCQNFKEKFADFIGAEADEIALTLNTSEGINIVAQGMEWEPGDNVVLPDTEYPANVYPWMNLSDQQVEVRRVPSLEGRYPLEQMEKYIDNRTRVVAVSHVQFSSGYRMDLAQLGNFCRERNIYFVVDAIQSLGVFPVDVKEMKIDFLSTSTYKWMLGPQGVGVFFIDRSRLNSIKPRWVGAESVVNPKDYLDYNLTFDPSAKRFEPGTYSTVGVAGAYAALELILELGLDFIQERIFGLTDLIYTETKKKGWEVYSPWEQNERSGIISISKPGIDPEKIRQLLLKNSILTVVRAGRLRLAPHHYNSPEEISKVINLIP